MSSASDYPPISDYGLIGDLHTCALVSRAGSIDWSCFPRFDSPSVFGRLLDWSKGGYFLLAPKGVHSVKRQYMEGTKILETMFETDSGRAVLTDVMPVTANVEHPRPREVRARRQIVRSLECVRGSIDFEMRCVPRFDYGYIVPHAGLYDEHHGLAHGGSDAISIYSSSPMQVEDDSYLSTGHLNMGESVCVAVTFEDNQPNSIDPLDPTELNARLQETLYFWQEWAGQCTYKGEYSDDVLRSALTLKAMTYAPSGAIIAAPTTSLPEVIGGVRNWDYRFTWIRDATFALYALFLVGYREEAHDFKHWMEWSTMGRARDLQVMYGLTGERRLTEIELLDLSGYRNSRPVRIGNAAYSQLQLDIYGEILDSAHLYRRFGGEMDLEYWSYLRHVIDFVLEHWTEPDEGIWEARTDKQHYVFSKVMCWVALDRAIKAASALELPGDVQRWKRVREEIRKDIETRGYDPDRGAFVQAYGSKVMDASALMLPLVGFIRPEDPRMQSTLKRIEEELMTPEGLVFRYRNMDDGLGGEEGAFLICSFWLVDNLIFAGQREKAVSLFEKLRTYSNDLDLFSEELDPHSLEMLGNFPQAFTHMGLINAAVQLGSEPRRPSYPGDSPFK